MTKRFRGRAHLQIQFCRVSALAVLLIVAVTGLSTPLAHAEASKPDQLDVPQTPKWAGRTSTDRRARIEFRQSEAGPVSSQWAGPGSGRRGEPLVRRGIFDRPYLARVGSAQTNIALGGYVDLLGTYLRSTGVDEGLSFEARRFNLFVTSRIAHYIRLTSEIEFEHGTEEIALETALVDILFHHALNLRGGILLTPLGKFNIAHDSPLYDVIDRPLVSTQIIPATLSEVGFGIFGSLYPEGEHKITYEIYAVNGLGDGVIAAEGTRLASGKGDAFGEDNNGRPAITGRFAYLAPRRFPVSFELGLSFYAGIYNTFELEGESLDEARWLNVVAVDSEFSWQWLTVRGEAAYVHVDLPAGLSELHARDQWGIYVEALATVVRRPVWVFQKAALILVSRVDHVDRNMDERVSSGEAIGDESTRLTLGISFRPAPMTSLRLGYWHQWERDVFRNPTRSGAVQFGIATYF